VLGDLGSGVALLVGEPLVGVEVDIAVDLDLAVEVHIAVEVHLAIDLDVGVDLVGVGAELVDLGASSIGLELLLLGGEGVAAGLGGTSLRFGGTALGLDLGDVGEVALRPRVLTALLELVVRSPSGDDHASDDHDEYGDGDEDDDGGVHSAPATHRSGPPHPADDAIGPSVPNVPVGCP
jgi:hypothetical protein